MPASRHVRSPPCRGGDPRCPKFGVIGALVIVVGSLLSANFRLLSANRADRRFGRVGLTSHNGKDAFDSVGPLLLIGWAEVGPGLLQAIAAVGSQPCAPSGSSVPGGGHATATAGTFDGDGTPETTAARATTRIRPVTVGHGTIAANTALPIAARHDSAMRRTPCGKRGCYGADSVLRRLTRPPPAGCNGRVTGDW